MHSRPVLTFCKYIITTIFLYFFLCCSLLSAGETQDNQPPTAGQFAEKSPVIVNGKELFMVLGVSSYPAEERARIVAGRITQAAADETIDPKELKIEQAGEIIELRIGKQMLMRLVPADAASEGISLDILSELALEKIKRAITEYRYERTPGVLLIKTGYALIATLLAALLIWLILRLFTFFGNLVQRRIKIKIVQLESKSHHLVNTEMFLEALAGILRIVKILTIIIVVYVYLHMVLGIYPWTRMYAERLLAIIIEPLQIMGLGIVNALPNLVLLVILYFVFRYILKLARLFFSRIERGRITLPNFEREWALPTYRIVRLFIILFGIIVAYPYIPGSGTDAFKGISIFIGVILSLGSSSILSHIIAGYSLIYRRAFRVGDRVQVNDIIGDIQDMRLLVTRLRSLKNEEVIIPNSIILNSTIVNYNGQDRERELILHTTVGIGYEVPWRQVEAMLLLAAKKTSGIRKEPRPFVLERSLGDFAINYELNAYCEDVSQMMQLYADLHRNILDVFNEYGVQIMTPNYERDTAQPKVVPKDQWYAPPAIDDSGEEE